MLQFQSKISRTPLVISRRVSSDWEQTSENRLQIWILNLLDLKISTRMARISLGNTIDWEVLQNFSSTLIEFLIRVFFTLVSWVLFNTMAASVRMGWYFFSKYADP